MKFAYIRASEYFTFAEQIFHSGAISHGEAIFHSPKANFVEKLHLVKKQGGVFLGVRYGILNPSVRFYWDVIGCAVDCARSGDLPIRRQVAGVKSCKFIR